MSFTPVSIDDLLAGEVQSSFRGVYNDDSSITIKDTLNHTTDLTLHTGVLVGLTLSINADNTKFDIATGSGIIVNRDPDPTNTVVTRVPFTETLAIVDDFLGDTFTYVFLDNTGTVITRITQPSTLDDLNDLIFLGKLRHDGGVIVTMDDNPIMAYGASRSHSTELVFSGGLRLKGAEISPNSTDLTVAVSAGILEQSGRGRAVNANNANEAATSAQTPIPVANFFKAFVNGTGELILDNSNNLLNPLLFNENGLGTLEVVQANNFTVLRVVQVAGVEAVVFYYGTEEFSSTAEALAAVQPTFVEHPDTIELSPLAKIAIKTNVTNFTDAIATGDAVIEFISRRV